MLSQSPLVEKFKYFKIGDQIDSQNEDIEYIQQLCENDNIEEVKKLIEKNPEIFRKTNFRENNVYHWSCSVEMMNIFENINIDCKQRNKDGQTALFTASNVECAKWLLERLPNDSLYDYDNQDRLPTFFVNGSVARFLYKYNPVRFDISHVADETNYNILFYADADRIKFIRDEHQELYQQLPKVDNFGNSILFYVPDIDALEELLKDDSIDINFIVDKNMKNAGKNALFFVNCPDVLESLIEKGIKIDQKDSYGSLCYFYMRNVKVLQKFIDIVKRNIEHNKKNDNHKPVVSFNERNRNGVHASVFLLKLSVEHLRAMKGTDFDPNASVFENSDITPLSYVNHKYKTHPEKQKMIKTLIDLNGYF